MNTAIPNIGCAETLRLMREAGAQLIDVREPDEWAQAHIPDSSLMPMGQLRVDELATDRPLVMVCRSGNRSMIAALQLQQAGFSQLYNLDGGLIAWSQEGHPLVTGM